MKYRVRQQYSHFMEIIVGLKHGGICTCLFWTMFIEDSEVFFLSFIPRCGPNYYDRTLNLFLYADKYRISSI